jgi:hypothetical protein
MGLCFRLLRRRGKLWLVSSSEVLGSVVCGVSWCFLDGKQQSAVFGDLGVEFWVCCDTSLYFVLFVGYGFLMNRIFQRCHFVCFFHVTHLTYDTATSFSSFSRGPLENMC